MEGETADRSAELRRVETWFLERGIPLFIADYDAETRIWTRALPFLTAAYLLLTIPFSADSWGAAAAEWAIAVALLPLAWVAGNLLDRRPTWSRPTQVGWIELGTFVVGPALPHLIEGEWVLAVVALVTGGVVLGLTYEVVAYGVVALAVWMAGRLLRSLGELRAAAVRALPFLLIFVTFFFFTAETWQTFARLEGLPYGLTLLLFVASGTAFVSARLRPDLEDLTHFADWPDVRGEAAGTPASHLDVDSAASVEVPLSVRERRNVLLVAVASQVILAVVVAVAIGGFFLLLGVLTADRELIHSWVQHDPHVYLTVRLSGRPLILAEEHIRVSGFLATFSGFYFGVYSVADPSFRQGLTDDSTTQLRSAFAARALYRAAVARAV